ALGAVNVSEIAACPNTYGLMCGSEDLIADLGGGSSRTADGDYRDVAQHVRSSTLLAARAHDRYALDSIWADTPNLHGLAAESEDAVQSGFSGKASIHPNHVPVVRDALRPSAEQLRRARPARAHHRHALDSIWADIPNLGGLAAEAEDAVRPGFSGKGSIHPNHVPVVRDAFRPSDEQLRGARAVLDRARTEKGACASEGKMIDAPLLKHAERIVARAD